MRYECHRTRVAGSVPCRVIAKLQPLTWRVIVGEGVGHLDWGVHQDWSDDELPWEFRRPNAVFFAVGPTGPDPGRV
ncbi:hypothetical protein [Nocardia panacis]|uniref:hypothetical protein n=1 Tax=Nocardia panacis TaxID=2340916 RepID=UPI0011C45F69|nr:hypothetical protein [Nocardia panacis]